MFFYLFKERVVEMKMFSFEEVKRLANDYQMVPIYEEYPADMETPIRIFKKLQKSKYMFLLESVEGNNENMRYSFIGRNPFLIFKSYGHSVLIENEGKVQETNEKDPQAILQTLCNKYKAPPILGMPSFLGGAVGYFSYDSVRLFENLPNVPEDDLQLPDIHFMFVDEVIVFDHRKQKLMIIVNIHTHEKLEENYKKARNRIQEIINELKKEVSDFSICKDSKANADVVSNISKDRYLEAVKKAKEYILNGDIFQIVLAQRFSIKTNIDPFKVYRALRNINPSPYMYYLSFDNHQLVGASPERLIRVENKIVQTCPIAGSRKCGSSEYENLKQAQELKSDEKENAEHVMLVDLGRNDIGKVCEFGTVQVTKFKNLQRFSHIMHLVSEVEGQLRSDCTKFDALAAALPAGTLSGAPKIRAMEIIDELETIKRNIYGGAIGYIGFNGSFDTCITIRTALFKDQVAYIGAGAGIVYDSIAEKEYEECCQKAKVMIQAIQEAGEY